MLAIIFIYQKIKKIITWIIIGFFYYYIDNCTLSLSKNIENSLSDPPKDCWSTKRLQKSEKWYPTNIIS